MLLIDAYNVLNVEGVLPNHLAAPNLIQLVGMLARSRYAARPTKLVCDGHLSSQIQTHLRTKAAGHATSVRYEGVDLIFSGPGEEADDVIEHLLTHHAGSASLLVVSSDRRLRRAARRAGAAHRTSEAFLRELAADLSRPSSGEVPSFASKTPLDHDQTRYWMRQFGLGEPDFSRTERPSHLPTEEPPPPKEAQNPPVVDPDLFGLIEKSGLEIDLAELDMQRWVQGVQPFRPFSPD